MKLKIKILAALLIVGSLCSVHSAAGMAEVISAAWFPVASVGLLKVSSHYCKFKETSKEEIERINKECQAAQVDGSIQPCWVAPDEAYYCSTVFRNIITGGCMGFLLGALTESLDSSPLPFDQKILFHAVIWSVISAYFLGYNPKDGSLSLLDRFKNKFLAPRKS